MYSENNYNRNKAGWIEVITGSMFSGKTEELIRRLKRAKIANQKTIIFKPKLDDRYAQNKLVSHDSNELSSIAIDHSNEILNQTEDIDVIGIDEVQFFNDDLIAVVESLANKGKRVILAGLDMDYKGKPFNPIPQLMSIAEYITKVHAICVNCGNLAHYSNRKSESDELIELGEKDVYEPLCRTCYNKLKNK